jgi:hypothetical protein
MNPSLSALTDVCIRTLEGLEAPVGGATKVVPDAPPCEGVYIIDTAPLFAGLAGETDVVSLDRMCLRLGLQPDCMHNAGNDAYVRAPQHLLVLTQCQ